MSQFGLTILKSIARFATGTTHKKESNMAPVDLTKVLKEEHEGKWVVLTEDYKKVIAVGDSVDEIAKYNGKGVFLKVTFDPIFL